MQKKERKREKNAAFGNQGLLIIKSDTEQLNNEESWIALQIYVPCPGYGM